jgi:S1-C subfamily serine protease
MVRNEIASFVATAALLAGAVAPAAETAPAAAAQPGGQAQLEQRLDAARQRLDAAAQEVAELSAQLGGPMQDRMLFTRRIGPGRALLGVQVDPDSKGGAKVLEVSPGGAAAEAGIRAGDLIVMLDGTDLRKAEAPARELVERMRDLKPDAKVKVEVLRDGRKQDFQLTPRPMPPMFTAAMPISPGSAGIRVPFPEGATVIGGRLGPLGPEGIGADEGPVTVLRTEPGGNVFFERRGGDFGGMELATLSPQLGAYFGARAGVLVVRAGEHLATPLHDGDVIVAIDGREPTSAAHATRILRSYQRGEKLSLKLLREKKAVTLDVTLPPG